LVKESSIDSFTNIKKRYKMQFYNIKDKYIDYLRKFEPKVLFNKDEKRPYVGVVFALGKTNYYVPLASPKAKFAHMNNSKDFHKIAGGKYGAINFNKMIPVHESVLIKLDIEKEKDEFYKNLLRNQYNVLVTMKDILFRKSSAIYTLFIGCAKLSEHDIRIKDRCCNFLLLEQKMQEYIAESKTLILQNQSKSFEMENPDKEPENLVLEKETLSTAEV